MLLPFKYNRIIRDSLGEVKGGYFANERLWSQLYTDYKTLDSLFIFFDKQDNNKLDSKISHKDFELIINCIEVTLKELGEEDMHIHTGIEWEDALRLYEELKKLRNRPN